MYIYLQRDLLNRRDCLKERWNHITSHYYVAIWFFIVTCALYCRLANQLQRFRKVLAMRDLNSWANQELVDLVKTQYTARDDKGLYFCMEVDQHI